MDNPQLAAIRNIGIIAHIDAGKTTTTERILYYTGEVHRMGDVDKGTTTTDYLEEERQRGITIVAAAITCKWKDVTINIIDTPGHVDFTAEVERSLRVLDGAIVIFSAVEGVEAQSETVWRQATKYAVPRVCFINKMDRIGAEYERVFDEITDRLDSHPIPVQIPIGAGPEGTMGEFKGLIDLVTMKALYYKFEDYGSSVTEAEIPEDLMPDAELWRERMLNALADFDEGFGEAYMAFLEGGDLAEADVVAGLRRATLTGQAQPVFCGSSFKFVGVQRLLDGVAAYLPIPARPPARRRDAPQARHRGHPQARARRAVLGAGLQDHQRRPRRPLLRPDLLGDPEVGQSRPYNPGRDKKEICSRLYHIRADERVKIEEGLRRRHRRRGRPEGLGHGRHLVRRLAPDLAREDRVPRDRHQHVDRAGHLGRQGEARRHPGQPRPRGPDLRLQGQRGDRADPDLGDGRAPHGDPQEPDDPRLQAQGPRRPPPGQLPRDDQEERQGGRRPCIRQTGGSGLFARVKIDLEHEVQPKGGPTLVFVNKLKGGVIPAEFIPSIEAGLREEAKSGGRTGFPLVDLKVTLTDGDVHDTDSNDTAFRFAATDALRKAVVEAGSTLLEPVMKLEVVTPEDYLGDVMADLLSRRTQIEKMFERGKLKVVEARAPLEKMFGYSTAVRSLSQGRASYSMEPLEYAAAPDELLESLAGS